jgi:putative chitinase
MEGDMKIDLNLGDTQLILSECKRNGLTRQQTAYILATARWETAHTMKPVEEAFWLSEEWRAKNLRYYPWHGRGYVQLTWQTNYIRAGKKLDLDLITDPDRVMEPFIAAQILVVGSMEGWFTGKGLDSYINKTRTDYVEARRVINGTDKAQAIADLAQRYEAALPEAREVAPRASTGGLAAMIAAFFAALFGKGQT